MIILSIAFLISGKRIILPFAEMYKKIAKGRWGKMQDQYVHELIANT
jgi:hypothetical protein